MNNYQCRMRNYTVNGDKMVFFFAKSLRSLRPLWLRFYRKGAKETQKTMTPKITNLSPFAVYSPLYYSW